MAQDRVEAVERALTILEAFDSPQESFSLNDLAGATGYYKSTLLRLLGSLERFGYVQRGRDGHYRIGHAPMRLSRRHSPSRRLEAWIRPLLDRLVTDSGETASLIEVNGDMAECLLVAIPDVALRHELRPGQCWAIEHASPMLTFDGGIMVGKTLRQITDEADWWLALSGPKGRLVPDQAARQLDDAIIELGRHPTGA
ncbi:helix-turn-helix domain-containing protein [Aidingimonas lacisalsi]|uniref:helix-turn-helix domain-containing protein n=1 Tax=Aidingimonas lacisalsi TaxID=2604086 RepID=UPI0011D240A1|nr:helix-turn-helix domain-containing protein [Aidingimonas lacisalsi]